MEPESSLPCSQEPSTGPYPEPSCLSKIHLRLCLEFIILLISSGIKFWFVNVFPKYLNCATFSKHHLSLCYGFDLHPGDEAATLLRFWR
jgi:hypothetical protein